MDRVAWTLGILPLLGLAGLSQVGCSGGCPPCDATCPSFVGTYTIELSGTTDTCSGWYLVTGTHTLEVTSQEAGAITLNIGGVQEYVGTLCASDDAAPPRLFSFGAAFVEVPQEGVRVTYSMSGNLVDHGAGQPRTMSGSVTLSVNDNGRACTLGGSFTGGE